MKFLNTLVAASAAVLCLAGAATANDLLKVGTLACDIDPSIGFVIGSHRDGSCTYRGTDGTETTYTADIARIGLDLGVTAGQKIVWVVFATNDSADLSGTYVGGTAEASLGIGGNANVLYGGSAKSVALQPVSGGVQLGFNLALGGTVFTLTAD